MAPLSWHPQMGPEPRQILWLAPLASAASVWSTHTAAFVSCHILELLKLKTYKPGVVFITVSGKSLQHPSIDSGLSGHVFKR